MTSEERLNEILTKCMTDEGIRLWQHIKSRIFPIWDRPCSSTGKYHLREDGSIPSVLEHTLEMLYAASKLLAMFDIKNKTKDADIVLLSVLLHDSLKYGTEPENKPHTLQKHDQVIGDAVRASRNLFRKTYDENQINILEESVRFHSGRWSTDLKGKVFNPKNFTFQTMFLHTLDMLSTNDCLKLPSNGAKVDVLSEQHDTNS